MSKQLQVSIKMGNQIVLAVTAAASVSTVLYTGKVHVTGGREAAAKSSDGRLDIIFLSQELPARVLILNNFSRQGGLPVFWEQCRSTRQLSKSNFLRRRP